MMVCWIFMILLGCRLPHASVCQCQGPVKEKYHLKTVCAEDTVSVSCPNLAGEEISFTLIKDGDVLFNYTCNFEKVPTNCSSNLSTGVALHEHNKSVSFNLTKVSNGFYRCEAAVTYPPPYLREKSSLFILVFAEEHKCNMKNPEKAETRTGVPGFGLWIWICVTAVLIIYGTAVTIIAVVNYMRFKHSDSQSDYMNTKPRAPKDRKKKRGLENPIPRHF